MAKRKNAYSLDDVESTVFRALPYRPTRKLRPTLEPSIVSRNFRAKEFIDERGDFYERQRDGTWERWLRVTEKLGVNGEVLYRYEPEVKPSDHDDKEDLHDDLVFLAQAFQGWLEEAEELRIFGPTALVGIRKSLKKLTKALKDVRAEIELLRPAGLPKM